MKIVDVIDALEPDSKLVIESMVSRAGMNGDATVDQLMTAYPYTNLEMTRDERLALVSLVFIRSNKFAPKLDFVKRCEILALYRKGITREALSVMYNVDRRTVTHIYNPASMHYKPVRQEETTLGRERFQETYLTPEILNKALMFVAKKRAGESSNNKYADKRAGLHVVRGQSCEYDHRVMIQWREPDGDIRTAGWYYRDLDGDMPYNWFTADEDALRSSQACYSGMLNDITDKLG